MFLLQKDGTAVANLWLSDTLDKTLYWELHWPVEYVDNSTVAPTLLPAPMSR